MADDNSASGESNALEVVVFTVVKGREAKYEQAFVEAQAMIAAAKGYLKHEVRRCVEQPGQYLMLVGWRTVEDHTVGFRESAAYAEWRRQLHHFHDPLPSARHYLPISGAGRG